MTPAGKIQAAIDKLETLKVESIGGEWRVLPDPGYGERRIQAYFENEYNGNTRIADVRSGFELAELIVTLHRTIDAQLAILRTGLRRVEEWLDPNSDFGYQPLLDGDGSAADPGALALADAILGEDS